MSVKDELHELVDRLGDDRTLQALEYLRRLVAESGASIDVSDGPSEHARPIAVNGREFMAQIPADLRSIAARQGVKPVEDFDNLLGDFWPEDETAEEFIATIREWRSEGADA